VENVEGKPGKKTKTWTPITKENLERKPGGKKTWTPITRERKPGHPSLGKKTWKNLDTHHPSFMPILYDLVQSESEHLWSRVIGETNVTIKRKRIGTIYILLWRNGSRWHGGS
jgi:hypothetical protein